MDTPTMEYRSLLAALVFCSLAPSLLYPEKGVFDSNDRDMRVGRDPME